VVYAFVGVENVKFVFMASSDCCTGGGCPFLPPDSLGGLGRAMMEWVLTTGFLEQVFRNEQVRRDIRNRPGPGVGPLMRARRGVSANGLHPHPPPKPAAARGQDIKRGLRPPPTGARGASRRRRADWY
jgi:hypothetical protein